MTAPTMDGNAPSTGEVDLSSPSWAHQSVLGRLPRGLLVAHPGHPPLHFVPPLVPADPGQPADLGGGEAAGGAEAQDRDLVVRAEGGQRLQHRLRLTPAERLGLRTEPVEPE